MAISFSSTELINECRYPFRTPNPADTVTTIISELKDTENSIDSAQVNSEVDELATTKGFFGGTKNARPCLHIKLCLTSEQLNLAKFEGAFTKLTEYRPTGTYNSTHIT